MANTSSTKAKFLVRWLNNNLSGKPSGSAAPWLSAKRQDQSAYSKSGDFSSHRFRFVCHLITLSLEQYRLRNRQTNLLGRVREIRKSAKTERESKARKLLKKRVAELTGGMFIVDEEKITFEELVTDLKNDYQVNGKRSLNSVLYYLPYLRGFFGFDRAIDITPDRVRPTKATDSARAPRTQRLTVKWQRSRLRHLFLRPLRFASPIFNPGNQR